MSVQDQNTEKRLEVLKSQPASYSVSECPEDLMTKPHALSALESLSQKIDLCLRKQKQVRFIAKEIADIVKKSS